MGCTTSCIAVDSNDKIYNKEEERDGEEFRALYYPTRGGPKVYLSNLSTCPSATLSTVSFYQPKYLPSASTTASALPPPPSSPSGSTCSDVLSWSGNESPAQRVTAMDAPGRQMYSSRRPPLYGGVVMYRRASSQQQQSLFGGCGRRLPQHHHYPTTPLTPIHELREMTSSEMTDCCPTVVSNDSTIDESYRLLLIKKRDRNYLPSHTRRRSDPFPRSTSRSKLIRPREKCATLAAVPAF